MTTLREQIEAGVACWCENVPKGHPDRQEAWWLSDLVTDIVAEIKKGPIGVLLREAEWGCNGGFCPSCEGAEPGRYAEDGEVSQIGHTADCKLTAVLKDFCP